MKKIYAILGATGSIGKTLAKELTTAGHTVVAGVRNPAKAAGLDELIDTDIQEVDTDSWSSVDSFFGELNQRHGRLDGFAVCVGSILLKPAHLTTPEEFESVINKNLKPCCAAIRSSAKLMMKNGGSIVFVSSAAGRQGLPNHDAIAAAKAGIQGLTLSCAATYASYGIRVNCVAPGLVDSEMSQPIIQNAHSLKASQAMHPLGRIGRPSDVAQAIAWLLSSNQSWITGQIIGVDGGLANLVSKKR
ncbi:MAG: SDR family oxidoreductase [Verrucomicrobiota bacterium]